MDALSPLSTSSLSPTSPLSLQTGVSAPIPTSVLSTPRRYMRREWKRTKPHLPRSDSLPNLCLVPARPLFVCAVCGFANTLVPLCLWCAWTEPGAARAFEAAMPRARRLSAPARAWPVYRRDGCSGGGKVAAAARRGTSEEERKRGRMSVSSETEASSVAVLTPAEVMLELPTEASQRQSTSSSLEEDDEEGGKRRREGVVMVRTGGDGGDGGYGRDHDDAVIRVEGTRRADDGSGATGAFGGYPTEEEEATEMADEEDDHDRDDEAAMRAEAEIQSLPSDWPSAHPTQHARYPSSPSQTRHTAANTSVDAGRGASVGALEDEKEKADSNRTSLLRADAASKASSCSLRHRRHLPPLFLVPPTSSQSNAPIEHDVSLLTPSSPCSDSEALFMMQAESIPEGARSVPALHSFPASPDSPTTAHNLTWRTGSGRALRRKNRLSVLKRKSSFSLRQCAQAGGLTAGSPVATTDISADATPTPREPAVQFVSGVPEPTPVSFAPLPLVSPRSRPTPLHMPAVPPSPTRCYLPPSNSASGIPTPRSSCDGPPPSPLRASTGANAPNVRLGHPSRPYYSAIRKNMGRSTSPVPLPGLPKSRPSSTDFALPPNAASMSAGSLVSAGGNAYIQPQVRQTGHSRVPTGDTLDAVDRDEVHSDADEEGYYVPRGTRSLDCGERLAAHCVPPSLSQLSINLSLGTSAAEKKRRTRPASLALPLSFSRIRRRGGTNAHIVVAPVLEDEGSRTHTRANSRATNRSVLLPTPPPSSTAAGFSLSGETELRMALARLRGADADRSPEHVEREYVFREMGRGASPSPFPSSSPSGPSSPISAKGGCKKTGARARMSRIGKGIKDFLVFRRGGLGGGGSGLELSRRSMSAAASAPSAMSSLSMNADRRGRSMDSHACCAHVR